MPFTVSHVAAVLPAHRWLSRAGLFTAAVIGSIVPDFGVILFHDVGRWRTHSAFGLLRFCLPVGLILFVLTRYLVKPAFVEVLPAGPYARVHAVSRNPSLGPLDWCAVALVIVLGAITHLVWDGFTHEGAPGVRMFPVLDEVGPDIDGHTLRLWRILQYGSSVVGLIAVLVALGVWLRHAQRQRPAQPVGRRLTAAERGFWSALYLAIPFAYLALSVIRHGAGGYWPPLGMHLGVLLYALMRGAVASLLLVSVLIRLRLLTAAQSAAR